MIKRRYVTGLAVGVAVMMISQEICYAQIGAACMAARRIRKARQEESQKANNQNSDVKKDNAVLGEGRSSATEAVAASEEKAATGTAQKE